MPLLWCDDSAAVSVLLLRFLWLNPNVLPPNHKRPNDQQINSICFCPSSEGAPWLIVKFDIERTLRFRIDFSSTAVTVVFVALADNLWHASNETICHNIGVFEWFQFINFLAVTFCSLPIYRKESRTLERVIDHWSTAIEESHAAICRSFWACVCVSEFVYI